MRKLVFITLCFILYSFVNLQAAVISISSAQTIATNFFKVTYPGAGVHGQISTILKYTQLESDSSVDFYVFDINENAGFVIVSAHDEVIPVLAYSNQSAFTPNIKQIGIYDWITQTASQIHNTVLQHILADGRINALWLAYQNGVKPASAKSSAVGALLSTTWNQEPYYNLDCPINSADQQLSVTGCVATAMAQIMKYWNYPARGTGSFSYQDTYANGDQLNIGTLSANFGATTYQWTQMPNYLTGNNAAIATLMSHCGISVAMDYSDVGSGAYVLQVEANSAFGQANAPCAQHSYVSYFNYNPNSIQGVYQANYSAADWITLIEGEISAGRVVQYQGIDPYAGGHTWVCDGFDVNDNLHMNWGWGGVDNGYFAANNLSAGGYTFSYNDAALIGIEPLNYNPATDTACTASASFAYQNIGGSLIQFTNNSTANQVFKSNWTFYNSGGSFTTSTATSPQITFTGQPPYSAKLVIYDSISTGCTDSITQTVSFNPNSTCKTFQQGITRSTGASIFSDYAVGFDYATPYPEFLANQWTNGGSTEGRGLLKYDLSQIPAGSIVVSANLSLYADTLNNLNGHEGQPTYGSDNACYLHLITSNWDPSTVTWSNQPSATNTNEVLLPQSTNDAESYLNIDISSFAQSWINTPNQNYGMLLQIITQNYYNMMNFCSPGFADSAKWPKLDICYIPINACSAHASFIQQNTGNATVIFTNTSTDNHPYSSNWTFYNSGGQFNSSNLDNPQITFTGQPPYRAVLIITDSVCSDTLSQIVNLSNCITFQQGSSKGIGASVFSDYNIGFNYSTGYPEFLGSQWTSGGAPAEGRGLLKYDLSQIPVGSVIVSANLSLYADTLNTINGSLGQPTYGSNNACYLHRITSSWDPATVNWNTQPASSTTNEKLLAQSTTLAESYLDIDISDFVQNWVNNPNTNYGMLLQIITQNYYNSMLFCSSGHADSTKWPRLDICYQFASPCHILASFTQQNLGNSAVQFTNTSTSNSNTICNWVFNNGNGAFANSTINNPAITFTGPFPYTATLSITDTTTGCIDTLQEIVNLTGCLTLKQGSSQVSGASIFSNYNVGFDYSTAYPEFLASQWTSGGATTEARGLLKYNLSQIPAGSVITSASLKLYADTLNNINGHLGQPTYGTNNTCYLHRITSAWDPATVNWTNQPGATTTHEVLLPQSINNAEDYLNIDLSNFVQAWVDSPNQNYGILLQMVSQNYYNMMNFCSPGNADSSRWPELDICYSAAQNCIISDSFYYQNSGGDTVQFTNASTSSQGFTSYWVFSNSNGQFETSTQTNPVTVFTGSAPYYAILTIADSAKTSCVDSFFEIINVTTAISKPGNLAFNLSISPNPNNGSSFNIHLPTDYDLQTTEIKLYDMLGRAVRFIVIEKDADHCRLSIENSAEQGIYTVSVSSSSKQQFGKLVLVK